MAIDFVLVGVIAGNIIWLGVSPTTHPVYLAFRFVKWFLFGGPPGAWSRACAATRKQGQRAKVATDYASACKSGCPFDFAGNIVDLSEAKRRFPHLV